MMKRQITNTKKTNNYSDDDEDKTMPFATPLQFHQDLINQLNTFILTDEERDC